MSRTTPAVEERPDDVRARILQAADALLATGGRDALTTRAVSAAAGVQAPAMYRLFGDKRGLLDAVAEHGMQKYLAKKKARAPRTDVLEDFRVSWDLNVAFGLAHPALYAIMSEPRRDQRVSPAAESGLEFLRQRVRRLAAAGLLRVPEARAVGLTRVAGMGTVFTLLSMPEQARDPGLAVAARESVIAAITTKAAADDHAYVSAAITLRASHDAAGGLTAGERHLLGELLDRIAAR